MTVFSDEITIYAGADFQNDYFIEDLSVAISTITSGTTTTITTLTPHGLTTGGYVNLRGINGTATLNASHQATVLTATTFTVAINTTGTAPTGGTANRPINVTGWTFASQLRDSLHSKPGYPGIVGSINAGSREVLIHGEFTLQEGDEISITGSGVTNSEILEIDRYPSEAGSTVNRAVLVLANAATVTVSRAKVTRNTKVIATMTVAIMNSLTGWFRLSLPQATTDTLAIPQSGTDEVYHFDIKYRADIIRVLILGTAKIIPLATKVLL